VDEPSEKLPYTRRPPLKIQDYAVIGDCRAAALIGHNGSLDWLCWPRFDSPSIFAAILDSERGGRWQIAPVGTYSSSRQYSGESNVLETTFVCGSGVAVLTDLMPVCSEEHKRETLLADHEVLRQIECTGGEVEIELAFEPRANYGRDPVRLRDRGTLGFSLEVGAGVYWLRGTHPVERHPSEIIGRFRLRAGELAYFSFSYAEDAPAVLPRLGEDARQRIRMSIEWWQAWARRANYDGPYREAVIRSALALKLLAYAPSGAIVAAPTTSLPERIGADLNWDYRFCWLRDASLTTRVLLGLGYHDEAEAFLEWMLHATRLTQPELRILYTVFGERAPAERELQHLSGYMRSRPVRVGNAARGQLQLDVYGEVMDAVAQFAFHILKPGERFDRTTQRVLIEMGKYVSRNWRRPDEGLWEPRTGRRNHTHSHLLCWTALDRLCKLAASGTLEGAPVELFGRERESIARQIREKAWDERSRSYVSTLDHVLSKLPAAGPFGRGVDASLLLLAWYGFEQPSSERMKSTWQAIERELKAGPGLLYRYHSQPQEGAFGICGFWAVEYLALGGGSQDEARVYFEELLSHRNDVGLFAEEIDPASGDALGNFPQGFTHIGLIGAALSLQERVEGRRQLPHRDAAVHTAHEVAR